MRIPLYSSGILRVVYNCVTKLYSLFRQLGQKGLQSCFLMFPIFHSLHVCELSFFKALKNPEKMKKNIVGMYYENASIYLNLMFLRPFFCTKNILAFSEIVMCFSTPRKYPLRGYLTLIFI